MQQDDYMSELAGHHLHALSELKREMHEKEKLERKKSLRVLREKMHRKKHAELVSSIQAELEKLVSPRLVKLLSDLRTDEIRRMIVDADSDPDTQTILRAILDAKET